MSNGEIVLYNTEDGKACIRLRMQDGTVWLSQSEMAELFATTPQNVTQHIRTIYSEAELDEAATCKSFLQVRLEGERQVERAIAFYRLEMILAVGFRVRSARGTQFRQWATSTLKDYLVKGFVLDDDRLKEPVGGWDYFDELLERIRSIRASEKRFYQKVRDLFATSADYDGTLETAKLFFQTIQNKLLYAVTGHTAAELIVARADASQSNMALATWQGGQVRKGDVIVAKNYLNETEVRELDRLVSSFLELAEDRAGRRQQTTMQGWASFVNSYLALAERDILTGAGRISHEAMMKITSERYASFDANRKETERVAAEMEHEQDIEDELKMIEKLSKTKRKSH